MKAVVYADGPFEEVEVPSGENGSYIARKGEPIEVPDELAGRPPGGSPGEEGYDPGEGLLAQSCWSPGPGRRAPRSDAAGIAPPAADGDGGDDA